MQFNSHHKIGQNIVTVEFLTPQSFEFWASFSDSLKRIGGEPQKTLKTWQFPSFITSQVIQEIINNTCFECGGLMKDGTAMVDQQFEFPSEEYGTVKQTIPGHAKQIKVRKCTSCGHSHT